MCIRDRYRVHLIIKHRVNLNSPKHGRKISLIYEIFFRTSLQYRSAKPPVLNTLNRAALNWMRCHPVRNSLDNTTCSRWRKRHEDPSKSNYPGVYTPHPLRFSWHFFYSMYAVSYTHLDVYKRQVLGPVNADHIFWGRCQIPGIETSRRNQSQYRVCLLYTSQTTESSRKQTNWYLLITN